MKPLDRSSENIKRYEQYAKWTTHYLREVSLPETLLRRFEGAGTVVDLGCGDGVLLRTVSDLVGAGWKLVGVDISENRCREASRNVPTAELICSDVRRVPIASRCADVVTCNMVIEHLEDRRPLLSEIARLLKPNGIGYITSVVKKRWAVYVYRSKGRFVLDPTHVIEYGSLEEFVQELNAGDLQVLEGRTMPTVYPISDLCLRAAQRVGVLGEERARRMHSGSAFLRFLNRLRVRVPGYYWAAATVASISS